MERKKQLRMLGLAALLPLFVLVWVLSSEEPLPPGEKEAVEEAICIAKESGARRAIPIAVSAPSHCALMIEASKRLVGELEKIKFTPPVIPIVNNADAMFLNTTGSIKASLIKQLDSPLLWEDSIRNILESGIDTFIEVGPGKILSGLIKRIDTGVKTLNTDKDMEEILSKIK